MSKECSQKDFPLADNGPFLCVYGVDRSEKERVLQKELEYEVIECIRNSVYKLIRVLKN